MPPFTGVSHVALRVTDLDVSQRFYTEVLDFLLLLDVGFGRVCLHKPTGLTISLIRDQQMGGSRFGSGEIGLDHIGLPAETRDELVAWEERFVSAGVRFTPILDMPRGYFLRFRDPDGIPLEFQAPNDTYAAAMRDLRSRNVPDEERLALIEKMVGPQFEVQLN